jgi:site-specific DNA recombinase
VLYGRVSNNRVETKSVRDQLAELREWANRERWQIVGEFSDDGISASRYAQKKVRPGWTAVVEQLAAGEADILAVWEISRASRDRPIFATLLTQCADSGVLIATGGRLHDPSDADDGFMLDLTGALAVRESHVMSKRIKRASRSRAAEGRPHGSLGYGYRRVCDRLTGRTERWEPDPDTATIVVEIIERIVHEETGESIARDLNKRGILTPNNGARWHRNTVKKIAQRAAYAGLRTHHGRILEDVTTAWPALITPAQHYAVLARYNAPERDRWRNAATLKHLGTGIYRCGRCDGRMRVVPASGKPNRYACRECHRVSRLQAPVDELVEAVIIARLSQPDILALKQGDDAEVERLQAEAARLRAKRSELRDAWDQDRMSTDAYVDLDARTRSKLEAIEKQLRPRVVSPMVTEIAGEWAEKKWAEISVATRRALLDTLAVVTILPETRRFQSFDPQSVKIVWR